jgi:agmatine deiminase
MKRTLWATCALLWILSRSGTAGGSHADPGWRFPGEFESHQAMWLLWPTFENKAGFPSSDPMAEMIRAMSGRTHVNLAVQDAGDEAGARAVLTSKHVPLGHVHFVHLPHGDIWARDMGPQFTRNRDDELRITDWNFNMWGHESPDSDASTFEESFDRRVGVRFRIPVSIAREGPRTGVRLIHEGGSATHNGRGTMVAVESVVMQRNLGPRRFCGGAAPITDYASPNTYAPHPGWPACRALVEREYQRQLGARKIIWVPTGIVEDNATFRGRLAPHLSVPVLDGEAVPHSGVYTVFTTNGHVDEFIRFISPTHVVLAEEPLPATPPRDEAETLIQWMQTQNHVRLERVHAVLAGATTESGEPIRITRIPMPVPTLEVFRPGDGIYDYFGAYEDWEDGSTLPPLMMGVWAASYVNYVPTNGLVLVSKFGEPGRPREVFRRDAAARDVLARLFPGRAVVQVDTKNVNRGGGGMNCITQQQPASATFAERCGWAKVEVGVSAAPLYSEWFGEQRIGIVPRVTRTGEPVYVRRLSSFAGRVEVRVAGPLNLDGEIGWIDAGVLESAGERCPAVYSRN